MTIISLAAPAEDIRPLECANVARDLPDLGRRQFFTEAGHVTLSGRDHTKYLRRARALGRRARQIVSVGLTAFRRIRTAVRAMAFGAMLQIKRTRARCLARGKTRLRGRRTNTDDTDRRYRRDRN